MMADAEHLTSTAGSARDSNGPVADASSNASSRLQLIDPAQWPTNTFDILAQYDDAAECFRLTPPHDWASDEIPFYVVKGNGKGKGNASGPIPDLLPKGERKVKEPTPDEMAKFSGVADVLTWAKVPGTATWRGSAAGRLMDLLGCADDDELVDISEFELNLNYFNQC